MKSTYQNLADRIKKLTVFCIEHSANCFAEFQPHNLFKYCAFNLLNGNLFAVWENGEVQMIAFAWRANAGELLRRDAAKEPQFDWRPEQPNGDALLIGQITGNRKLSGEIIKQVMAQWPESPRLRVFIYRKRNGAAVMKEVNWKILQRFCHEQPKHT